MPKSRLEAFSDGVIAVIITLTQCLITIHGRESDIARWLRDDRKGKISVLIYAIAIPLAFVQWWIAFGLYAVVAAMWFVPDRRIESHAEGKAAH